MRDVWAVAFNKDGSATPLRTRFVTPEREAAMQKLGYTRIDTGFTLLRNAQGYARTLGYRVCKPFSFDN